MIPDSKNSTNVEDEVLVDRESKPLCGKHASLPKEVILKPQNPVQAKLNFAANFDEGNTIFYYNEDDVREEDPQNDDHPDVSLENDGIDNVPRFNFLHAQTTSGKQSAMSTTSEGKNKKKQKKVTLVKKIKNKIVHVSVEHVSYKDKEL